MCFNSKNQISQKYINKFNNLIDKNTPFGPKNNSLYPTCYEDCWRFLGRIESIDGYGRIEVDQNKSILAHRLSYIINIGDIPVNLLIRHICDIKSCVNPKHLLLGTHMDNRNDAIERNKAPFGEKCGSTRLENNDILQILQDVLNNKYKNINEICENYDVLPVTLSKMFSGDTWKTITKEFCQTNNVTLSSIRKIVKDDRFTHSLEENDVIIIKNELQSGTSVKQIAKDFSVTTSLIYGIKNNKIWKHVII